MTNKCEVYIYGDYCSISDGFYGVGKSIAFGILISERQKIEIWSEYKKMKGRVGNLVGLSHLSQYTAYTPKFVVLTD